MSHRSTMEEEEEETVDVIRIPLYGFCHLDIVKLHLLSAGTLGFPTAESWQSEDYLKYVPDFMKDVDWLSYGWKHRSLVDLGNMDPAQTTEERSKHHGPYFLYKCSKKGAGHVQNGHFEKVPGAKDVYGSAFIFKVKEPAFDTRGIVSYDELDEDFIKDAFKGKGIAADESLKWLAAQ